MGEIVANFSKKCLDYYPFGLKHAGYNSDQLMYIKQGTTTKIVPVPPLFTTSYQYKYNGKELQEELGLNLYDFGGRQYMQDLGRTTTLDPLAEKFYDLSPQSFLNNNPLRFIDPTGMEAEASGNTIDDRPTYRGGHWSDGVRGVNPDDDYRISKNGKSELIKKTKDNFDRIYNEDNSKNIQIQKGIANQMAQDRPISKVGEDSFTPSYATSAFNKKTESDYFNLFKFVADNSNVEFSLTFYKADNQNKVSLSTFHDIGSTYSPAVFGISNPNKNVFSHYHSHPGINANKGSEVFSIQGNTGTSDYGNSYYGNRTYPNYIYFPNSSKLYNVTPATINYIKKINNGGNLKN